MTKEKLTVLHRDLEILARHLMQKKNADYANGDDPFLNFRASSNYNVHPAKGILIRMSDKMSRINSYIERGDFKVEDESLRDTAIDIINYTVLLVGLLEENNSNDLNIDPDAYSPSDTHEEHMRKKQKDIEKTLKRYEERKNVNDTTWNKEKD